MEHKNRTCGLVFFSFLVILSGMFISLFTAACLLDLPEALKLAEKIPYLSVVLFYVEIPQSMLKVFLPARLAIGLLQITLGILFFEVKRGTLRGIRLLMIGFLASTVLNPFYSYWLIAAFSLWYFMFLNFLYDEKIEQGFQKGFLEKRKFKWEKTLSEIEQGRQKSKGVDALALLAICTGLLVLRVSLGEVPSGGMNLSIATYIVPHFDLVIPKVVFVIVGISFLFTGLLVLCYKSLGRLLMMIFCAVGLVLSCFGMLFIDPATMRVSKYIYFPVLVLVLLYSFSGFLLMSNPRVKTQFKRVRERFSPKKISCGLVL